MSRILTVSAIFIIGLTYFEGCGGSDEGNKSGVGERCTKNDDCESGLKCIYLKCATEGDAGQDTGVDTGQGDSGHGDSGHDTDASVSEVWTDSATGLTWQKVAPSNDWIWESAKNYCANLNLGGQSGWRLPTISELRSLVRGCPGTETSGSCGVTDQCLNDGSCWTDECKACIDWTEEGIGCMWPSQLSGICDVFDWYWSSSAVPDIDSSVWTVDFFGGYVMYVSNDSNLEVRCVR